MRKTMQSDLRVKKTEQAIRQALLALLQEKNIRKITVRELTQHAEINKTTFYAHYETLDALIETLEEEAIQEILLRVQDFQSFLENSDVFIDSFQSALQAHHIPGISQFQAYDPQFAQKVTAAILKEMEKHGVDPVQYRPYGALSLFLFKGLLEVVLTPEYSDAESMDYIKAFIRGGLKGYSNALM